MPPPAKSSKKQTTSVRRPLWSAGDWKDTKGTTNKEAWEFVGWQLKKDDGDSKKRYTLSCTQGKEKANIVFDLSKEGGNPTVSMETDMSSGLYIRNNGHKALAKAIFDLLIKDGGATHQTIQLTSSSGPSFAGADELRDALTSYISEQGKDNTQVTFIGAAGEQLFVVKGKGVDENSVSVVDSRHCPPQAS